MTAKRSLPPALELSDLPQHLRMRRLNGKQHRTALYLNREAAESEHHQLEREGKRSDSTTERAQPQSKRKKPGGDLPVAGE